MMKSKQIKELKEQLKIANIKVADQEKLIEKLRKSNTFLIDNHIRFINTMSKHDAPVKFIQCSARKTSYLVFADGHYVKVKLHKGDKANNEIALVYLLAKNSYNIDKCQKLIKNKVMIKPGEKLPIDINPKK